MRTEARSLLLLLLLQLANRISAKDPPEQWLSDYWNKLAKAELMKAAMLNLNTNIAKNVILVVGDGMGMSTVTAARILKGQLNGGYGEEASLSWESFPHVALSKTYNTNLQTADSAGTATAYHFGFKTKAGVIGLDDSVQLGNCSSEVAASKYTSILQWAEAGGKSTGIVTTTRITHASPSPLYAQSAHRDWESDADLPADAAGKCKDISLQLIENGLGIEVVMGGGRQGFLSNTTSDPEYTTKKGKRLDGRNLITEWIAAQAQLKKKCNYVWNLNDFNKVNPADDCLLALFEPSHMLYEEQRMATPGNEPSLTEMVDKAIQILQKNPKGFYLFIEGGRIDHGHHDSLARNALTEAVELDRAVQRAVNMTDSDDTLIAVTADHSHVFTIGGYAERGNPILGINIAPDGYSFGSDGKPLTAILYGNGPGYNVSGRQNLTGVRTDAPGYVYQSAVPLKQETHGGEDVAIYAYGPMSHLLHGVQEQSYIPHALAFAACIGADTSHCTPAKSAAIQLLVPSTLSCIASLILALLMSMNL